MVIASDVQPVVESADTTRELSQNLTCATGALSRLSELRRVSYTCCCWFISIEGQTVEDHSNFDETERQR